MNDQTVGNEKNIMVVRKHWFFLLAQIAHIIVIGVVPLIIFVLAFFLPETIPFAAAIMHLGATLIGIWLLVLWMAIAITWMDYYLDTITVTSERIHRIEQEGFFDRRTISWHLNSVLDVTVHVSGVVETILGFGTVTIETAGEGTGDESFKGIPHPQAVRAKILEQIHFLHSLVEVNKRQEALIHAVGHDVKSHLTTSQATLASIVEGDFGAVPDRVKAVAKKALKDARSGVSSVTNLLHSADGATGVISLHSTSVPLSPLITEVVSALRPAAEKKNLALIVHDLPSITVQADPERLKNDVVRNLVDNAIRYTPQGSITVSLEVQQELAVLSIADTGVGISSNDLQRLFTDGGKGEHSSAVNPESTGFGLTIAQRTTEAHGGKIWVVSGGEGKGSTFFVALPLSVAS
ncbi:hypothetical protein EBR66_04075 [bacterium]|nr:hypothetical protein [bacterium]